MKRLQQQTTISAYEMEVIQKAFTNTLRWLEFYIEKSGYYNNWQRQISETIRRQDLNNQPGEIKGFMETALLALDGLDKPEFICEGLQEQFYSWLEKSGVKTDNCPKELAECLINIEKVLNNDGKEFVERVDREADEDIARMTQAERRQNFNQTFTIAQRLMDGARARKESLKGKTYKDVNAENKFSGNSENGQLIFAQIKSQLEENAPREVCGSCRGDEVIVRNENGELIYEAAVDEVEVNRWANQQLNSDERNLIEQEKQKNVNNLSGDDKYWLLGGGSLLVAIGGWGVWLFRRK